MTREQVKATYYVQQLEEARCQGNWNAIPELIRKIKKHAPERSCLVTVAESEHAIAIAAQNSTIHESLTHDSTMNTISSPNFSAFSGTSKYIKLLTEEIKKEQTYDEDVFQAQVCLSSIHWYLCEYELAASRAPTSIGQENALTRGISNETSDLIKLYILKAIFIKANSHQKKEENDVAMSSYKAALPIIPNIIASPNQGKEVLIWTELFLTSLCMLSSDTASSKITLTSLTETLFVFRLWAKFWSAQASEPVGGYVNNLNLPRRFVWKEYYATLSVLLQYDPQFSFKYLSTASYNSSTKKQQRDELQQIEVLYESLLMSEIPFPKSHETSEEIEEYVEIKMRNWRVLCGTNWTEQELGENGIEALSRGTLETLYRAAKKTFHSTAILRHLFTVHLAVAEFDLASKAFDIYVSMVKKIKANPLTIGKPRKGVDNDEMVFRTTSKFIEAICRYGFQQAAEKAREISLFLESLLETYDRVDLNSEEKYEQDHLHSTNTANVSPVIFALAWRAVGIGYAQWARFTFDAASRSDIQAEAVKCFRKALLPQYESSTDPRTLYALGVILAERREISDAIETVKKGLLHASSDGQSIREKHHAKCFARERLLIPLWHLLVLLLSARQEFLTAKKSCEVVFDQFRASETDRIELKEKSRDDHLDKNLFDPDESTMVDFYDYEKQNLLEVKMTELTLIELFEGPDVAVNSCGELLSLYARLFGDPQTDKDKQSIKIDSPKSPSGTIKSFRIGILGRSGQKMTQASPKSNDMNMNPNINLSKVPTTSSEAPAIHVISDPSKAATRQSLSVSGHTKGPKRSISHLRKTDNNHLNSESLRKGRARSKSSGAVIGQFANQSLAHSHSLEIIFSNSSGNTSDIPPTQSDRIPSPNSTRRSTHDPNQEKFGQDDYIGLACTPVIENPEFLKHSSPETQFPKDQSIKKKLIILFRVWILISGFYRRASMYDEASSAINEAQRLVTQIENSVSENSNTILSTDDWKWGAGKSIMELWGDIYAELGHIALADDSPHSALNYYETALTFFRDHPSSIVGLSNILMDLYTEDIHSPPLIPALILPKIITPSLSPLNTTNVIPATVSSNKSDKPSDLYRVTQGYLDTLKGRVKDISRSDLLNDSASEVDSISSGESFTKNLSTSHLDRLATRDRAFGLLTSLTKTGSGWNNSEAWFALARAYELSGQPDKARDVLWWCVELEESRAVRDWTTAGSGGYVL